MSLPEGMNVERGVFSIYGLPDYIIEQLPPIVPLAYLNIYLHVKNASSIPTDRLEFIEWMEKIHMFIALLTGEYFPDEWMRDDIFARRALTTLSVARRLVNREPTYNRISYNIPERGEIISYVARAV